MLLKFISVPVFIISLALGLFFVYMYGEDRKVVYVYPTPDNVAKILYKDRSDNCFQVKATEVDCAEASNVKEIPAQT
jgi:hypothetical protein